MRDAKHPFVVTKFNLIDVPFFNSISFSFPLNVRCSCSMLDVPVPFSFDYYDPNIMFSPFNEFELVRTHFEIVHHRAQSTEPNR